MEATKDLLDKILPPRIEDAGLEDCALPPDSIHEAFRKAAAAVGSIFSGTGGYADDHFPSEPSDDLVGITDGVDPAAGSCEGEKGGSVPDVSGGDVVSGADAEEVGDDVVVGGGELPEKGDACVDGLQGVEVGETEGDGEDRDGKRPILTEAFV